MRSRRRMLSYLASALPACGLLALWAMPDPLALAQRKKKEDITQTLPPRRDLPAAVVGETRRLAFHTTPLSGKGLLSQQVRDALKVLAHETNRETVLKIRAFVAGSADLRRVRDLVSDNFSAHKQPLPALTLLQSGGLPLEGAQIEMEAVAAARREVNPHGLAWISATVATSGDPLGPVAPLAGKSLEGLLRSVKAAGSEAADVVRITCFLSSLQGLSETRDRVRAEYPHAAADYVQTQRAPGRALSACEAVVRLRSTPAEPLRFVSVEGAGAEPGAAAVAQVGAHEVILTGGQYSFGYQDADGRLAFQRLVKSLEAAGATGANVAFANLYPLAPSLATQVRKLRSEFWSAEHPPAGTVLLFEGLPSMDAGFGVEAVAVK